MSNLKNIITLSEDYGDVINVDNFIFEKQQLVIEDFSYSIKAEDIIHISGIVFDVDDNNILQGNAHREWTATEVALASLPENTSKLWEHPNLGIENLTFEQLDRDLTFEVVHSGVARIMTISLTTTPSLFNVYINNVVRGKFETSINSSILKAVSFPVAKGDVIKVPGVYSRIIVLPFVYPYED
jgi:hypothetical protein